MKKLLFALVAAALAVPALAQDAKAPNPGKDAPALEMQRDHEAFKKAHEEHKAQLKATQEKMEKLVKEYNKASGKKKEAKRAEIEKEVGAIHDKQMEFRKDQLAKFEERLARMKAEFEKDSSAEGKNAWVSEKTNALIEANGDVKALFPRPHMRGPHGKHGPRMGDGKGAFMGKGPRGERPQLDD